MDCSVVATRLPGVLMVTTTDFFYPLVEDPYLQGRIGACNVLSDLYAMGVTNVDTVLMILAASLDMTSDERDIVTTQLIKGFNDTCAEADTNVTGGQTVLNPWPIIGGTACALCTEDEIIRPTGAAPGDVLVLTKPLGTQVAVNCQEWSHMVDKVSRITDVISCKKTAPAIPLPLFLPYHLFAVDVAQQAFAKACESMGRLNRIGAEMMHKVNMMPPTHLCQALSPPLPLSAVRCQGGHRCHWVWNIGPHTAPRRVAGGSRGA
jgi:selenide,water dikinase